VRRPRRYETVAVSQSRQCVLRSEAHPESSQGGSARLAWYIVFVLGLLFAVSLVDRFILALLVQPISHDLGLSDAQLGLLIGTGFAVLYSMVSVVAAHWIDNRDRRKIVALGALLWGSTTGASAFATNFGTLLALRAGVAIGEAVLTPAAVSLIADVFPRDRRALPMSVYLAVGAVMGIGSYTVGGGALDIASLIARHVTLAPWRITLLLVGAASVVLGLVMRFTVQEPARMEDRAHPPGDTDLRAFLAYLRSNAAFYLPFMLGGGMYALYGLSLVTWLPTILVRAHGYRPAQAGYVYGLLGVPAGLISMFLWPRFTIWIEGHRPLRGAPIGLFVASVIGIPVFAATTALTNTRFVLAGVVCATLLASAWSILPPLCFQQFGPSRMRARLMALNLLAINLIGFGLGPVITVWFSGFWDTDPHALGYGLAAIGAIGAVGASVCYLACMRKMGQLQRHER
jgi:MFS family permease